MLLVMVGVQTVMASFYRLAGKKASGDKELLTDVLEDCDIGLQVPHAHEHLISLRTMDDINFSIPKLNPAQEDLLR